MALLPLKKLMIYSGDIWNEWVQKTEEDFELKKYIHFDHPIDFSKRKSEIQKLFTIEGAIAKHNFLPLIKIITKTPRFKYQDDLRKYDLETKERPISFASHLDTLIYGFYSFALNKKYQTYIRQEGFSDCVLAYRTDLDGKCNIQFAKEVFEIIKQKGPCTVLALDIKGYFDSIDHTKLKEKWSQILGKRLPEDDYSIFRSLTKYSYVKQTSLLKHFDLNIKGKKVKKPVSYSVLLDGKSQSEKLNHVRDANLIVTNKTHRINGIKKENFGIPQGSALSALLSNIYLVDFDKFMFELGQTMGFVYRRYCDDILIICNTPDAYSIQKTAIEKISQEYFLTIQDQKVEIIEFCKNSKNQIRAFNLRKIAAELPSQLNSSNEQLYYKSLQYLGFEFTGQKILIRNSSISRYFRKMRARIVKSVGMAYGASGYSDRVFKEQIFHRYTHLGKRNFLHYAYQASQKFYKVKKGVKDGLDSPAIKKQLSRHFDIIHRSLSTKNTKRFAYKSKSTEGLKLKHV